MVGNLIDMLGGNSLAFSENVLLRAFLAALTAFAATALSTRWLLLILARLGVCERVDKTDSEPLKNLHKGKASTPTMGGIAMVAGFGVAVLSWTPAGHPHVLTGLLLVLGFALLGFLDDWIKLTRSERKGLTIRGKLGAQFLLAFAGALALYLLGRGPDGAVAIHVPFVSALVAPLPPVVYVGFATLVLVVTVNAVNFTDGLDGLASGCAVVTGITLSALAYLAGGAATASGLGIPFVEGAGELAVFGAALAGCGLGFLWHNCFPARLFMGDTGSMALGAAIGYVAVAVKQELLLPIVGAVFVAEGLSVLLQVLSFRLTGKRLFLIAPLHHRYQFLGWPESRITIRFWISAVVSAAAGAVVLKI
ncbi:MAG: phospho-N-acetylmuramoyl-pentapeptide-transferase [Planctomycetota bacterium]|jgi:phospho-N-acetylmuramoyl-pentapeptide-transferase